MKSFVLLVLSLCLAHSALAQEAAAKVENIKFRNLQNDWVQMEVQIRANRNLAENAKSERFVDNIKVLGYFAYVRDAKTRTFDFYKAEVEIISIEQGKKENVYFFMPGVIVKRDRLPKIPPYYFVALEINGQIQPIDSNAYSTGTLNDQTIRSMKTKADAESGPNEFILKPHYNVSLGQIGARIEKLAPLIIREPKL